MSQTWAFHAGDATLPAAALHAGVSHSPWLKLRKESELSIGDSTPDEKDTSIFELTQTLRPTFKNNPVFAQTVRHRFAQDLQGGLIMWRMALSERLLSSSNLSDSTRAQTIYTWETFMVRQGQCRQYLIIKF